MKESQKLPITLTFIPSVSDKPHLSLLISLINLIEYSAIVSIKICQLDSHIGESASCVQFQYFIQYSFIRGRQLYTEICS